MSDYTPTTEEVRAAFRNGSRLGWHSRRGKAFDRWLAEVVREAKEEAWFLGASAAVNYALSGNEYPENPFEKEE